MRPPPSWTSRRSRSLRGALACCLAASAHTTAADAHDCTPHSWILSRLNAAAETMATSMGKYDFAGATSAIYSFWQYELCDVYIELV